jgi:hypothetical protein
MSFTFCRKNHGNRFLFLQFPAWERRRPRRLAVGILTIQESPRQLGLHSYSRTLIVSQNMSRRGRPMSFTFCRKNHGSRFLFLQFPAWERRRPRRLAVGILTIQESPR